MNDLDNLQNLVDDLNKTNSTLDKKKTLGKYPECKKILKYIYDPLKQFFITSINIKKQEVIKHIDSISFSDIYDLLNALSGRKITGHAAIVSAKLFIEKNKKHEQLIYNIIDKDLKTRTDAKIINKVFQNLIPVFNVALADKYNGKNANFSKDDWYASRKLDGCRVLTIIDGNSIKFFSRQGKEFFTLDILKKEIENESLPKNIVLDGEVCIINDNGIENFKDIIKVIRKKDFTIPNPRYNIFDVIPLEIFQDQEGGKIFTDRIKELKKIIPVKNHHLSIIEQKPIKNEEQLVEHLNFAEDQGWEGLILRKSVSYEGKRSKNMLKVKKFHDDEFIVRNIITGQIRFIENGKEKSEEMLSAVEIKYKGNMVGVGSGFSIEQRREFFKNPKKIIGKTITVKYFGESQNDKGEYSLRFPTLKHIWEKGRDV